MILCTLFNWAYLAQGVTLYRSIKRHLGDDFVLYMLCMDEFTAGCVASLNLPNARVIHLREIEDEALLAVKPHRSLGEYCWTCTTSLILHVQSLHLENTVVTYVDADIAFFSSPRVILDELGDRSIFAHEHDYATEHQHLIGQSGRFNVGVTAFRKDAEGRKCLDRWKAQCVAECVMDPAAGKCGDQNYLDEWPDLYPGLVASTNPGVGLAPWNITKRALSLGADGTVSVDGLPAVFYHFHGLRLLRSRLGVNPTLLFRGAYRVSARAIDLFYAPYAAECWESIAPFEKIVAAFTPLPDIVPRMEDHQVLFLKGRRGFLKGWRFLPMSDNPKTMGDLYGFDEARQPPAAG